MYKNIRLIMLGFLIVGSECAYGVDFINNVTVRTAALVASSLQATAVADTQTTWLDRAATVAPIIAYQLPGRYGTVASFVTSFVVAGRGAYLNRNFFNKECTVDRVIEVSLANVYSLLAFCAVNEGIRVSFLGQEPLKKLEKYPWFRSLIRLPDDAFQVPSN